MPMIASNSKLDMRILIMLLIKTNRIEFEIEKLTDHAEAFFALLGHDFLLVLLDSYSNINKTVLRHFIVIRFMTLF